MSDTQSSGGVGVSVVRRIWNVVFFFSNFSTYWVEYLGWMIELGYRAFGDEGCSVGVIRLVVVIISVVD